MSLSSEPTATTTVGITGHEDASIALSGLSASSTLTFTATNWDTPQTVTVTADEDDNAVDEPATLTHTANGGDYEDVTKDLTVTVTDDEVTDLKLSATSLNPVEGNTGGTTYTVRLTSQPTAAVTVTIGGHADTDLTLSAATLTFTPTNWNSGQTVTVKAGEDDDAHDDTATLTHTASGGDYKDVTKDLSVTVADDETAAIVLSESSLEPVENATGATYTVHLSHVPTVTVTVGIGGHTGTDLTLSATTLTFTTSNWSTAQTVTVTASHDADAVNDRETLTHTAEGGEYAGVRKELPVTVDDDEETGVVLSAESLGPIAEGTDVSYTVRLSSEPTATTTVGIGGHGDAPLSLSGLSASSTLTFTATNWDTPQTVTVTADEDPDAVDDEITLTHTANGGDYQDVTKELPVTVTDDEVTNVLVSRAELSVEEGNATGTSYTVKLSSEPTAAVTVEIGGHSGTDLRLSGVSTSSTLTFTASNWDTAQTVTVRANEDADAADDTATLTHTASGGDYAGVTRDLPVRVDDDETASIVLSKNSLEPVENATGATYTVKLSHVPTETVTVGIGGHTGTDLTLSATTLTFDSSNWNSPRTVTVTAAHDADAVNDVKTLTHTASGGEYGDVRKELPVRVNDDEETGVVLSPESLGPVAEGTDVSYTVSLSSQPTATATVGITGHVDAPFSLSGLSASSTLTFTATNWDTPRTVTVTADEDPDAVDDSVTLTHTANGGDYVNITEKLTVTVTDDEETDLKLSATSLNPVEGGSAQTYTVRLTSQPTATVNVEIGGHTGTDLTLSAATLTFTTSNWNEAQTVTVTAAEDADAYNDRATLTHTASGGDYGGVTRDLPVRVNDDETASLVVTPTEIGVVEQNATGATYTVHLSHVPTVTVTVEIGGHSGTDLALSGVSASSTLTFDSSNWNSPRTVTVTASHDDDAVNDPATLTHTARGGEYGGVTRDLPVTVDDDEETGVVLSPTSLGPVAEGSAQSYTVKLSSEPTATTTVVITGHGAAPVSLSGLSASSTLTFTATNWDTPRTVTVTATQDPDAVDDRATLTHTANGGDYVNVTKDIVVTVDDDEVTDLDLSATSLAPVEGGSAQTYTVRLTSQPARTVTVTIGGHTDTDLTLSGVSASSTLTFTASNWDTPQTVTVTAGDDPDAADDTATLKHTASGGDYEDVTRELAVRVEDDETALLVVTPTEIGVVEDSATGTTYTVRLSHVPTEEVKVIVSGQSGTDLTLSGLSASSTLTFNSSNWNSPRTVTVTASHDADAVNDRETLTHTAEGGEYQGREEGAAGHGGRRRGGRGRALGRVPGADRRGRR